jgi:hypothetical protein
VYDARPRATLTGTAVAGSYNTLTLEGGAAVLMVGKTLNLLSGSASPQSREILAFDETTKVAI